MKNINRKIKITLLSSILFGCNAGMNQNGKAVKQPHGLNATNLTSWSLLGANAEMSDKNKEDLGQIYLDYEHDKAPIFDPAKLRVSFPHAGQAKMDAKIIATSASIANSLFGSLNIHGSYGLFSASAEFSYLNSIASKTEGVSVVSHGEYMRSLEIDELAYRGIPIQDAFTADAKKLWNQIKKGEKQWSDFTEKYGNAYVKNIPIGASYDVVVNISSSDDEVTNELNIKAGLSYGSFLGLDATLKAMSEENLKQINVKYIVIENGLFPNNPTWVDQGLPKECTNLAEGLSTCVSELTKNQQGKFNNFVTNLNTATDKFTSLPVEQQTLMSFRNIMNTKMSVVQENIQQSSAGKQENIYKYGYLTAVNTPDKTELAKLQESVTTLMRTAAALGQDSSFAQALSKDNDLSEELQGLPGLDELIEKTARIATINNELFEPARMDEIVKACFTANSTYQTCHTKYTEVIQYDSNDKDKENVLISLENYKKELDELKSNATLNINGYYDNVTPIKANIFWLPIKTKGVEKLLPVYLNTKFKMAKPLNTSDFSGYNTTFQNKWKLFDNVPGLVFGDMKYTQDKNLAEFYPNFLPVPSDLTVEVTRNSSNSYIETAKRVTKNNILSQRSEYTTPLKCIDSKDPVLTNQNRDQDKVNIVKCPSTFADSLNLAFTTTPTPFYEALKYTKDKAVIDRGFHKIGYKGENSNKLLLTKYKYMEDVGDLSLSPGDPWCSPNGRFCVEYTSADGGIKITDSNNPNSPHIYDTKTGGTDEQKGSGEIGLITDSSWTQSLGYMKKSAGLVSYAEKIQNELKGNTSFPDFKAVCNGFKITNDGKFGCFMTVSAYAYIYDTVKQQLNSINSGDLSQQNRAKELIDQGNLAADSLGWNKDFKDPAYETRTYLKNWKIELDNDITKNCSVSILGEDRKYVTENSTSWPWRNNVLNVQFVCNQNTNYIKMHLVPGGKYGYNVASNQYCVTSNDLDYPNLKTGSGICMTNYENWEKIPQDNPLIATNSKEFKDVNIHGRVEVYRWIGNRGTVELGEYNAPAAQHFLYSQGRYHMGGIYADGWSSNEILLHVPYTTRLTAPVHVNFDGTKAMGLWRSTVDEGTYILSPYGHYNLCDMRDNFGLGSTAYIYRNAGKEFCITGDDGRRNKMVLINWYKTW